MLLPMTASAEIVEIDGICYNLITKGYVAEVSKKTNNYYYTGSVVIPEKVEYEGNVYSVTSIGNSAFCYCGELNSVTIPYSITGIGNKAFEECRSLTSITIPNSVTSMGKYIFYGCTSLTTITISNSLTSIEDYAFSCCSSLSSITIPNSVTSIGCESFSYCRNLTSITLPNSITTIGESAFMGCHGFNAITIPNSVINMGDYVFTDCENLNYVTIGNGVTSLGKRIFAKCINLISVTTGNNIKKIDNYAFSECISLTSFQIPNSVTSIGMLAFEKCTSLTYITIPNNVKDIREGTFNGCSSLASVTIGTGIKTIESYAFSNCPELKDVYCYATNVPTTNNTAFKGSYIEYATLHVPDASINAYSKVEPWKNFKAIVGLDGTTPVSHKCETPTISYDKGQLKFVSATEGAEFITDITNSDIKKHYDANISLTATYNISVYATKSGYDNSDAATATLCWIESDPKTEGITDGVAQIPAKAVLIQSEGGILKVEGIDDGTPVSIFTPDGKNAGSAVCRNGAALVDTNIQPGTVAIVKIDNQAVKVVIK